jgi:predicted Zn-dependent protease
MAAFYGIIPSIKPTTEKPEESLPANSEEEIANDQFLACGSKIIADLTPTGTKLGTIVLTQLEQDPRYQFSNVSFSVSRSGTVTINTSRTAGSKHSHTHTLSVHVTWPDRKRKREESGTEGYQAGKTIGE